MIVPVILSGGSGTRLWPLSRELFPKQLMPILGGEFSLLQSTVLRLRGIPETAPPIVVCNENHRFMVAAQLQAIGMPPSAIILEPVGRNTAPAAAVAAFEAMRDGSDPTLLILPADHMIRENTPFSSAVQMGERMTADGGMITFGIHPHGPETGYGYIKKSGAVDTGATPGDDEARAYHVSEFVEKPDHETACAYVASGGYLWNSGMFMFRASTYLRELERLAPEMISPCKKAFLEAKRDLDFLRLDAASFQSCPGDSIDYAVMEKTSKAVVIPLVGSGWSDVGSWPSLHEVLDKDEQGNVVIGDVMMEDVRNCYLHSSGRLIAAVGMENHVVVETKDAILVTSLDRGQDVKSIVKRLNSAKREETILHPRVYRPWGSYECIDCSERFQVKRITVNPGATLSLQLHHHRAEHWVVVRGTARITRGDEVILLSEDQSTYIPLGTKHRLENPGKIPLELIEVQTGSYLGEDDIVRLEDVYGR
ncbi:mannose-1-phosphate guanylyltransferase/mannose-6-phosphate isomerase [Desulforhabdus amnigena]|uniref:mannose-1-phosphate guanylyltransferase n=1 Tax=Desulforhabdus amnigena TaxID=40218 RepID=A0A9W6LAU3_9BACT|nr:mannose-1-phosphate guanylyltransferase/mannose-6-phosphate isomerase [Desulforhabdus amnigena]NLJ28684.1 mannose-1-phosphate guanylyltransferase/mannose-6-phosphate isomerase [Deltaproteobacteria bacterium]GLI36479.1 xanthan biosynthesis protein XanB [Desulforhabdus amnigena]